MGGEGSERRRDDETEPLSEAALDRVQLDTFRYIVAEADSSTGLIRDSTRAGSPSSIAAVGMALSCYPVAVERGWLSRREAVGLCLKILRFLQSSEQSRYAAAAGYRGFYYHFLDMRTGRRAWRSELSTIDTAILMAGALTAAAYFTRDSGEERELRETVDELYRRVDWRWMVRRRGLICHGWKPGSGFLRYDWAGYNEALLLYVLALGSESSPVEPEAYGAWCEGYRWDCVHGESYFHAPPLFIHQLPQVWLPLRGIADAPMRARGLDYWENSRRATLAQVRYAEENPRGFRGYGSLTWGITACDGPGPAVRRVAGRPVRFYGYRARGVPDGPDDGTLAPWAAICSLPFESELVLRTMDRYRRCDPEIMGCYGYSCCFNPTFAMPDGRPWMSGAYTGLDQGPVVLMIENYRTGMIWELMKSSAPIRRGLRRAGFTGGWLDQSAPAGSTGPPCGSTPLYPGRDTRDGA